MSLSSPRIAEIVLTGGSCAGKTEALEKLSAMLRRNGQRVITVPEVATMIIKGGVGDIGDIAREDGQAYCHFQRDVFLTHRELRRRAISMASNFVVPVVVVLYDRGELDGTAYHDHDCFEKLAAEDDTTIAAVRDSYSAVMHLVTTADGAEDFYTKANNSARWDNPVEARYFDTKILDAWRGHPRHFVFDNRTDFPGKLERLLAATLAVIEAPGQLQMDLGGTVLQLSNTLEMELPLESPISAVSV